MRKKICVPTIYPKSLDLSARWFVRFWSFSEEGRPKRIKVWVPSEPTLEKRLQAAQVIMDALTKHGYKPAEKTAKKYVAATKQVQLLMDHLEEIKLTLRRKTYMGYKSQIKTLDAYCARHKMKTLTEESAKMFLAEMLNEGKSSRTVNCYRVVLKSLFERLVDEKRLKDNPFVKTKRTQGVSTGSTYFKMHQIFELKKYMGDKYPFLWFAVRLIYYCFIRPGELRMVKVGDVDFDNWQIKIRHGISKNRKEQWVVIPEPLRKELEPLCLYQYPADFYLIGREGLPAPAPVAINFWGRYHLKMLRELNYTEAYNLYSWKHTGVVRAYKAGIGLKELQLQLRHHSLDMVKIYLESLGILDFSNIKDLFPAI